MISKCCGFRLSYLLLGGGLVLALTPSVNAQAPGGGLNGQMVNNIQGIADLLGNAVAQGAPRNEVNQIDHALQALLRALKFMGHGMGHGKGGGKGGPFGGGFNQFANAANGFNPGQFAGAGNGQGGHPHQHGQGGFGHKGQGGFGAFGGGMMQAGGPGNFATGHGGGMGRKWGRNGGQHHRGGRGSFGQGVFQVHNWDANAQNSGPAHGRKNGAIGKRPGGARAGGKGAFGGGINLTVNVTDTYIGRGNNHSMGKKNVGNVVAANTKGGHFGSKAGPVGTHVGHKGGQAHGNRPFAMPKGNPRTGKGGTLIARVGQKGGNRHGFTANGPGGHGKGGSKFGPRGATIGKAKNQGLATAHKGGNGKNRFTGQFAAHKNAGKQGMVFAKGGKKAGPHPMRAGKKVAPMGHAGMMAHKGPAGKNGGGRQPPAHRNSAAKGGNRAGPAHTQSAKRGGHKGTFAGHVGAHAGGGRGPAHGGATHVAAHRGGGRQAGGSVGAHHGSHAGGRRR